MDGLVGISLAKDRVRQLASDAKAVPVESVLALLQEIEDTDPVPTIDDDELRRIRSEVLIHCRKVEIDEASQKRMADYNAEIQAKMLIGQTNADSFRDNFRVVIEMGQSSMRSILLLTGGTTVALLGFMGSIASNERLVSLLPALVVAASFSAAGTLFAALSFAFARLSQERAYIKHMNHLHEEDVEAATERAFRGWRAAHFIGLYVAVGLFLISVFVALTAFNAI